MAATGFHYFLSLPLELRQEIYELATPPRFVHVKQSTEQGYDDFAERLRTEPNFLQLDESLTHFSFNWRSRIPSRSNQPTLERYGFSSSQSPYHPWKVSSLAPKICLHWLSCHPQIAWEFAKEAYFYSQAPIPALLHTCRESRDHLIRRGYQLTFKTRSSGPRTWFNYDVDILFISLEDSWRIGHRVLSGCRWDLGQFDPSDMQKVRRLALERSAQSLYLSHPRNDRINFTFHDMTSVLRLFQHLEELFLVEWTNEDMQHSCQPNDLSLKQPSVRHHAYDIQSLWSYQNVSEVDVLQQVFPARGCQYRHMISTGMYGDLLITNGGFERSSYFNMIQTSLTKKLSAYRDSLTSQYKSDMDVGWDIPAIRTVHILSDRWHEALGRERLRNIRQVYEYRKARQLQEERVRSAVKSSQQEEFDFEEDERAYEDALLEEREEGDTRFQKRWWIEKGITPFLDDL
ncbi:hypothetical protein NW762_012149 [Fusarium torreyae]|uniref:2EXR domain-containing protein n=1 Tax=Fusarium torreyae TaxID=1237075 RepID=A0A9W8RN50_9HYPO|nr:hypothetical protein NW762_012149 [Fusarium torreyae]